ncbi:MAG: hypothetical protein EPO24_03320 [Bacteroidetes bacterium]|nr:MAG: hypothetical protein EPO24_03320 [Bacteroidota bacterium]
MFVGAINDKMRKYLASEKESFRGKNISVIASGNFTSEQILSGVAQSIYSSDISLYSYVLGCYFTGIRPALVVNEPAWEHVMKFDNERLTAAMVVILAIAEFWKQKNDYQKRMCGHYLRNFDACVDKALDKLRKAKAKVKVDRYFHMDAGEMIERAISEGRTIFSFLPTYKGGYERIFKVYETFFSYPNTNYSVIDDKRYKELHDSIVESRCGYFIYADRKLYSNPTTMLAGNNRKDIFVYTNCIEKKKFFSAPALNEEIKNFKLLTDEDVITKDSVVTIQRTTNNVINHYRNLFLAKKVAKVANGVFCFLVFLNEKLFGFLIYDKLKFKHSSGGLFLLSDFVVKTKHKRLSKLVICIAKATDVIRVIEESSLQMFYGLTTAVFTKNAVSMKYRGEWELYKRNEDNLVYVTGIKQRTTQQEFSHWYEKHYSAASR